MDAKGFESRIQCIRDQYARHVMVDEVHIHSRLTSGEDVADLGGTLLAYLAWKQQTAGETLKAVDGFTPDQRFFVGMAQWACENSRPEDQRVNAVSDPHSPGLARINGVVSNMPEFQKAFGCKLGQPMVHVPVCTVWRGDPGVDREERLGHSAEANVRLAHLLVTVNFYTFRMDIPANQGDLMQLYRAFALSVVFHSSLSAHADTLFTITGGDGIFSFTLPTPAQPVSGGFRDTLFVLPMLVEDGSTIVHNASIIFNNSAGGGGLHIEEGLDGFDFLDETGPVVFAGTTANPVFLAQTVVFTADVAVCERNWDQVQRRCSHYLERCTCQRHS